MGTCGQHKLNNGKFFRPRCDHGCNLRVFGSRAALDTWRPTSSCRLPSVLHHPPLLGRLDDSSASFARAGVWLRCRLRSPCPPAPLPCRLDVARPSRSLQHFFACPALGPWLSRVQPLLRLARRWKRASDLKPSGGAQEYVHLVCRTGLQGFFGVSFRFEELLGIGIWAMSGVHASKA